MGIAVASDHAGFSLKQTVLTFLRGLGLTVEDLGKQSQEERRLRRLAKIEAIEAKCGSETL